MDRSDFCKVLFIMFCAILWVSGLSLIIVGAIFRTAFTDMEPVAGRMISHVPTLLAVVGFAISLIAFNGSVGARAESRVLLGLFTGFLFLILIVEIVMGIMLYVFSTKLEHKLTVSATAVIDWYNFTDRSSIDELQRKFHCCGVQNYTEWLQSRSWGNGSAVPNSCCRTTTPACGQNTTAGSIYHKGCVLAIKMYLQDSSVGIGVICVSLMLMELLGAVLGGLIFKNIQQERND